MIISKIAEDKKSFTSNIYYYNRARDGLDTIFKCNRDRMLLLPSFIGYSVNEGSGIFDPVIYNNMDYSFYRMTDALEIDLDHFQAVLENNINRKCLVLIVHYYGFIDPNFEQVLFLANKYECKIIEDCAHALFTDFVKGKCGRNCDFAIYSLHKMLPLCSGGLLKSKTPIPDGNQIEFVDLTQFDLFTIAEVRVKNSKYLEQKLLQKVPMLKPLRLLENFKNQIPQTYPVLIDESLRDEFYHFMNENGFGVVSLYHQLITPLYHYFWNDSLKLSRCITNLPIHQDCTFYDIDLMIDKICNFFELNYIKR